MTRQPDCHPERPLFCRTLCKPCYDHHDWAGTLEQFPYSRYQRSLIHFAEDYELLHSEGYTVGQIAERLGMRYHTAYTARRRAVVAGLITPDRRAAT